MKGRHVVILVFVFGLSLMAILFRVLGEAKPGVRPEPGESAPVEAKPQRTLPAPSDPRSSGAIQVTVKSKGAPVRGAIVSFQGSRTFELATGADGKCPVAQVEPGPWRIVAQSPGVAPSVAKATVETGGMANVELDLAAGVRIEGTVRDAAGNPVPGARIQMELPDPAFSTRTDGTGRYSIPNVPPGVHTLTASSERLRPQIVANLDLSTPGQTVTQDFTLPIGAVVAGRVVDDTGAPIGRAMITVSNEVARVVRSDEDGNFRAEGLGEGPITVSVTARGYASASEAAVAPGRTDVTVKLVRGAVLQGRVDGTPMPFTVNVSIYDAATTKWKVQDSQAFSDQSNGVFQIRDLPPGRYEVVVETAKSRTPAPLPAQLEAGQAFDIGVVVLAAK
jgi:hypothetical protein